VSAFGRVGVVIVLVLEEALSSQRFERSDGLLLTLDRVAPYGGVAALIRGRERSGPRTIDSPNNRLNFFN
jgi:hypothetical protein